MEEKILNKETDIGATAADHTGLTAQIDNPVLNNAPNINNAVDFLLTYFKGSVGYSYLWCNNKLKKLKVTIPFRVDNRETVSRAVSKAQKLNAKNYDIYFGVNVGDKPTDENHRYTDAEISRQVAIVADIDIAVDGHHKENNLAPDIETAKKLLPITPTYLIDTGGGIHPHYKFNIPLELTNDADRDAAALRGKNYLDVIREKARVFGFEGIDGVHDLPRILRLPFTYNCKDPKNKKLCTILKVGDNVTVEQIDALISSSNISASRVNTSEKRVDTQISAVDTFTLADYERALALAALDFIPTEKTAANGGNDWLAVNSACKNLGLDKEVAEWNKRDPEHYDELQNKRRYDSLKDPSFGLRTLIGIAKRYGFDAAKFKRKWLKEHPNITPQTQWENDFDSADFVDISDAANAQRLFDYCNGNVRYLHDVDKWALYDGQKWNISQNATAAPLYKYAVELGKSADNKKVAKTFSNTRKINATITLIKGIGDAIITRADLNNHPNLLNCKNGVVDLQTKQLYPADPLLLLTQMINAEYRADYHNDIVSNFLRGIIKDEDTLAALLRFLGYCLTGDVSEEKAMIFNGGGGNGKGTLTGTLLKLFGNYGTPFPVGAILSNKFGVDEDANAPTPAYNKLVDTRIAISEEVPQGRKISASKFKLLTGGDSIPIRRLHEEATEIERPTHKLIISGNYLPELQDAADAGIIRRLMNIQFKEKFDDKTRDIHLKKKLVTPDALSGLLTLLVDNAAQWYKSGLLESAEMTAAKKNYINEQDFISAFIDEYCAFSLSYSISMQALIEHLREHFNDETKFLSDKSLRPMLTKALESRAGIKRGRQNHTAVFFGVNIAATAVPNTDDDWDF